jgi:hypothetical protein
MSRHNRNSPRSTTVTIDYWSNVLEDANHYNPEIKITAKVSKSWEGDDIEEYGNKIVHSAGYWEHEVGDLQYDLTDKALDERMTAKVKQEIELATIDIHMTCIHKAEEE